MCVKCNAHAHDRSSSNTSLRLGLKSEHTAGPWLPFTALWIVSNKKYIQANACDIMNTRSFLTLNDDSQSRLCFEILESLPPLPRAPLGENFTQLSNDVPFVSLQCTYLSPASISAFYRFSGNVTNTETTSSRFSSLSTTSGPSLSEVRSMTRLN